MEISGSGTAGNVVAGNYIGTDFTGTVAISNGTGVKIDTGATGNTIGGLTATPGTGAGNVISGNTAAGVQIGTAAVDAATADNVVEGNLIGTDVTGENALPNLTYGVLAIGAGTTIGGTAAGALNVVSANADGNIVIAGGTTDDLVAGNYLGLDLTGTTTVGSIGVDLFVESPGNTIGGTTAAARNVISGTASTEISLNYSSATDNLIEGNYIGTNASGTAGLTAPNPTEIWEQNGSAGNTIGGTVAGAGNLVVGQEIPGRTPSR